MTTRQARLTGSVVRYVILTLLALMIVVPILWMISTSFKTEPQTYEPKPSWIPDPFSLVAYEKFFRTYSFGRMLLNSLATCLVSVLICIVFSCLSHIILLNSELR